MMTNMATMARDESYESADEKEFERYLAKVSEKLGLVFDDVSEEAEVAYNCFLDDYSVDECVAEFLARGI